MKLRVHGVIRATGVTSMALGVVLSPIPFADEVVLVPIYGGMTVAIARAHGLAPWNVPWRKVALAAGAGLAVRAAGNLAFAFVPGVAAISNALSAAVLTEVLGRYVDRTCAREAVVRRDRAAEADTPSNP